MLSAALMTGAVVVLLVALLIVRGRRDRPTKAEIEATRRRMADLQESDRVKTLRRLQEDAKRRMPKGDAA